MMPRSLSLVDCRVDRIIITGALRDGHWLHHQDNWLFDSATVLFVADDLADEARRIWPNVNCSELQNDPPRIVETEGGEA